MHLQFNQTVIPCLQTLKREIQTQELTQEVRLTDDMPDIGRVLAAWGQPIVRSKEWRSGSVSVSGGLMAWVLYVPEDGSEIQSIETWLPFQMKWEIPDTQRDGSILAMPLLRSVDARSLSARKLLVRGGIDMMAKILLPGEVSVFDPGQLPDDIQLLKKSYSVQLPKEFGEKAFVLEDILALPASDVGLRKLIRYDIQPQVLESKIIGDKLVIRGVSQLTILYLGTDGELHRWEFEVPYSQYTELDHEYGADSDAQIHMAVTVFELDQTEEGKLRLKVGLTAQYILWERAEIEITEDMYSPKRFVKPNYTQLQIPALHSRQVITIPVEQSAKTPGMQIVDSVLYTDQPMCRSEADGSVGEVSGLIQMLGYNNDGKPDCVSVRWEYEWKLPNEQMCMETYLIMAGKLQMIRSDELTDVRGELQLECFDLAPDGITTADSAEMDDTIVLDSNRPSLILRRPGKMTLWELAKQTGSTVDAIQKVNGLQKDPDEDQMLLIPIS